MKSKLLITTITFLASSILIFLSSCIFSPSISGNGNVQREKRIVGEFTEIKASDGLAVFLVKDDQSFVVVEADENLLNVIRTNIEGNTLEVNTSERIKWSKSRKVFIHYENLEVIKSSAGANIKTDGELMAKYLKIAASSGSHQNMTLNCFKLNASTSSGAQIKLSGKAENVNLKASSGAQLNCDNVSVEKCKADVSSGANISIGTIQELDGKASSGGHIFYKGNPKVNSRRSSGGQMIKR